MKYIIMNKSQLTVAVDDEDYDYLNQYTWYLHIKGYAGARKDGKYCLMHRLILNPPKGKMCDHIDGNKLNNTKKNLRIATNKENLRNRSKQKNNTTGYKGVHFCKARNKYQAQITIDKKFHFLGYFHTPEEAYKAYCTAAKLTFKEFYKG